MTTEAEEIAKERNIDPLKLANNSENSDIGSLTISTLIESISIVVALFIIDAKAVGRKE